MKYYTHILAGVLTYFILLSLNIFEPNITLLMAIVIGSLLPDIDHPNSYINNQLKITKPIGRTIKHRGITHSVEFIVILWAIFHFIGISYYIKVGIIIGVITHLVMDAMTISGIYVSYIFHGPHIRGPIRTGHTSEKVIFGILLLILLSIIYSSVNSFIFNI